MKLTAWDGSISQFWFAIQRVRDDDDIESDHAVLSEVLALARQAVLANALPDSWRDAARSVNDPKSPSIFVECADELEQVLTVMGET